MNMVIWVAQGPNTGVAVEAPLAVNAESMGDDGVMGEVRNHRAKRA